MSQSIIFRSLLILILDKQIFRGIFCIMKLSIQNMSYERLEKPDSVKKERIAKGKFIVETPEEEFSIPIDKLEEANFGRRSNCRRCKLKIPRQADLACGEWGVMGMEATFVEVCSAKGAELLKQAKIAGVVETFPPVPKGVEIRGKIEKSMLKLADGWREKDFQSLGEGKTRLKQLMDETSRCIKCYTCIEVCPALSGTKVSDFTITPGKVPPSFAFHESKINWKFTRKIADEKMSKYYAP